MNFPIIKKRQRKEKVKVYTTLTTENSGSFMTAAQLYISRTFQTNVVMHIG